MEVDHFRTIFHMFVAMLCVLAISTIVVDFIDEGRYGSEVGLGDFLMLHGATRVGLPLQRDICVQEMMLAFFKH